MVAPEVAVPGKTTAVLVTLHGRASDGPLDPLNVTVRLETQDAENGVKLLTTASQMITGNLFLIIIIIIGYKIIFRFFLRLLSN